MYKIDNVEKEILLNFKKSKIPEVFKFDYIEHMLFIELVDFEICTCILNGEKFSKDYYNSAMKDFILFKDIVETTKLNDEEMYYYEQCLRVMGIFEKYCSPK